MTSNPFHIRNLLVLQLGFLCTFPLSGQARLGLTKEKCDAIYGPAEQKNIDGSFLYIDGGFAYVVFFAGGVCDELFVLKPDPAGDSDDKLELSTDDVARFLDENRPSPELSWTPVEMQSGNGRGWTTDDTEFEAYLLPGGEQMNLSTTVAATARRMDLPRTASAPKSNPDDGNSTSTTGPAEQSMGKVETIFSEDEMTFYHLAFSARKIDDHKTVISALKSLYDLVRRNADDKADVANARFGYFFSWLGDAYEQSGRALMAVRCYQRYLEQFPLDDSALKTTVSVANNLTWVLATHIDTSIRSPEVAFEYALEMEKLESLPEPCYDTIAVAYAAVGKFDEALARLDSVAGQTRDPDLLRVLSQHRRLFQEGTVYIEDPDRR